MWGCRRFRGSSSSSDSGSMKIASSGFRPPYGRGNEGSLWVGEDEDGVLVPVLLVSGGVWGERRLARRLASSGKSSSKSDDEAREDVSRRGRRSEVVCSRRLRGGNVATAVATRAGQPSWRRGDEETCRRHAAAMGRVGSRCSRRRSIGWSNWLSGAWRPAEEVKEGGCLEILQDQASFFCVATMSLGSFWPFLGGRRSDRQHILCGQDPPARCA
jgi:hypothetical protein